VDRQFVSRPKPFQNNNLQFDAGLLRPTWRIDLLPVFVEFCFFFLADQRRRPDSLS
jgi:hypothetical protein